MLLPASFGSARCPGCSAYKAGRRHVRVQAEPEDEAPAPKKRLSKPKGERRRPTELPRTGFFGLADTKAPVYKPFAGMGSGDVTKRGGRWESDFIWNTSWEARMDAQADTAAAQRRRARGETDEKEPEGGLRASFARNDLNDMSVDLSAQLNRPKAATGGAAGGGERVVRPKKRKSGYAAKPPSSVESRRWQRSAGYVARGATRAPVMAEEMDEDLIEEAAAGQAEFERMKTEYSLWTTGTVAVASAAVFVLCPRDTAASYVVGALAGLVYLRLLNKSVDQFSSGDLSGGSVGGQTRLLIPVILVLFFNRFNTLYADQYNLTLELFPIIMGFFTYKAGVVGSGTVSLFRELSGAAFRERNAALEAGEDDYDEKIVEAQRMDRAFTRRMLTK